jgi:hypothetical protein
MDEALHNGEWHEGGERNQKGEVWRIGYWWDEVAWRYECDRENGLDAHQGRPTEEARNWMVGLVITYRSVAEKSLH